ncbi:DNA ligase LigA-related protein [Bacillus wiedmannii]|uniref:DNA ligase LigA-related protein n=1 Tax=Bacillus wiedmannii TaxID=1890302 RepID=UPI000BF06F8C|nr:hypothetical protein [Bacillus wiedmannii]PEM08539.1 hypothetical protein CN610_20010 [Bacillus wiedmannii]
MNIDKVKWKQRCFLLHSFLYYKLDESIIGDSQYDRLCKDMIAAMKEVPFDPLGHVGPYDALCCRAGEIGSGYYIKDYPIEIQTTALRVLWIHKQKTLGLEETFSQFISRWGYKILD